jgi:hypothetical protein
MNTIILSKYAIYVSWSETKIVKQVIKIKMKTMIVFQCFLMRFSMCSIMLFTVCFESFVKVFEKFVKVKIVSATTATMMLMASVCATS